MGEIADGSIDLVLCDLPYGSTSFAWDVVIPFEALWAHYKRLLKPHGAAVLTASQPFASILIVSNLDWFKYSLVWEKSRPSDIFNAKNKPLKIHEDVCIFSPGTIANCSPRRMTYNPQGVKIGGKVAANPRRRSSSVGPPRPSHAFNHVTHGEGYPRSVIRFPNPNEGSVHPTAKPVPLLEYLILTYSNEGDTVLDNCMGSGTTALACLNTKRRFIGIEKDPVMFEIAARRIERPHAPVIRQEVEPIGPLFAGMEE
jgi:site-specific DNA-methyltransferase (adenine-specific)